MQCWIRSMFQRASGFFRCVRVLNLRTHARKFAFSTVALPQHGVLRHKDVLVPECRLQLALLWGAARLPLPSRKVSTPSALCGALSRSRSSLTSGTSCGHAYDHCSRPDCTLTQHQTLFSAAECMPSYRAHRANSCYLLAL